MGENREAGEPRKNSVKSQYKRGRGRKRRGGRKREEERTPGAASQVDKVAAGESPRSGPCGAATSLSSPYSPVMGELGRCCCGARGQRGAIFPKICDFSRQYAKMGNRVCKNVPRLVFSFTRKKLKWSFRKPYRKRIKQGGVLFWKSGF